MALNIVCIYHTCLNAGLMDCQMLRSWVCQEGYIAAFNIPERQQDD